MWERGCAYVHVNVIDMLKKRKIKDHPIQKIAEFYEETRNVVRRGLKQGCLLCSLLFALYISDIEDHLKMWQAGEIVVGGQKFHTLAYADGHIIKKRWETQRWSWKKSHAKCEKTNMLKCKKKGEREE